MPAKTQGQSILENAYNLATPGDNTAYYNAFAATYDSDFVAQMGYQYPKKHGALDHLAGVALTRPRAAARLGLV